MARTKSFKELVQAQVKADKKFAEALLREGVDAMLSAWGEKLSAGDRKALLRGLSWRDEAAPPVIKMWSAVSVFVSWIRKFPLQLAKHEHRFAQTFNLSDEALAGCSEAGWWYPVQLHIVGRELFSHR